MQIGSNILPSNDYVPFYLRKCDLKLPMGGLHYLDFYKIVAEESGENGIESFLYRLLSPFLLDKPIIFAHSVKNAALKKGQGKHTLLLGNCEILI